MNVDELQVRLDRLPIITIEAIPNYYTSWTAPEPTHEGWIYAADGRQVGAASYAQSPLADRVYVSDIEIVAGRQRQGYATAFLRYLAQVYGQPITPIHELFHASSFWNAARRLKPAGVIVTAQISVSDMPREAERWQHLTDEASDFSSAQFG
ncbi:GNAT family N-acetyltransferase [Neorhizobium sp. T786]|uniref:GNAT family N-acetyltransferase n=1 Tax=Pseudorhizobium xiangyangii TaxID=2883104 RepID=UPI001CFF9163|nr:GNAT family N-acetyltransferase [Neorhizobium xiangyangii]MCB5205512.1 GNAT family N-acetyltransferase [Neorhizobium xiangyangii]